MGNGKPSTAGFPVGSRILRPFTEIMDVGHSFLVGYFGDHCATCFGGWLTAEGDEYGNGY